MEVMVLRVTGIFGEDGGVGSLGEWIGSSFSSDRTKGESSLEVTSAILVVRNLELCLTLLGTEGVGFFETVLRLLGGSSFCSVGWLFWKESLFGCGGQGKTCNTYTTRISLFSVRLNRTLNTRDRTLTRLASVNGR